MFKGNNTQKKSAIFVRADKIGIYQEGGEIVMGEPAAESEDPMMQLIAMATDALEAQDANLAMQVCQMLVEMTSGEEQMEQPVEDEMAGMEAEMPPMEGQPAPMRQGGVYRNGGKIPVKLTVENTGEYDEIIIAN